MLKKMQENSSKNKGQSQEIQLELSGKDDLVQEVKNENGARQVVKPINQSKIISQMVD